MPLMGPVTAMLPHQAVSHIVTVASFLNKYAHAGAMFAGAILNRPLMSANHISEEPGVVVVVVVVVVVGGGGGGGGGGSTGKSVLMIMGKYII